MIKRSKFDLMVSLLQACKTPLKRTAIVYRLNMNNQTAKILREEAEERGLIEKTEENDVVTYKTSKKGLKLLVKWKEVCDIYEGISKNGPKPWTS
jgi:predicted transcriptional regulator